jgi:hypothetical protein
LERITIKKKKKVTFFDKNKYPPQKIKRLESYQMGINQKEILLQNLHTSSPMASKL